MARLLTNGFETQRVQNVAAARDPEGYGFTFPAGAVSTAQARSGAASTLFTAGSLKQASFQFSGAVDREYYLRVAVRFSALPPTNNFEFLTEGLSRWSMRMTTGGVLQLRDPSSNVLDSISGLAAATWYVFEINWNVTSATTCTWEWRLGGASQGSGTFNPGGDVAIDTIVFGQIADSGNCNLFFDDFALNDNTGTQQTSWPGVGKVVLLKPDSDSSLGNWTGGAGGTSDLSQAVDNTPPVGVAIGASSTDATQIENSVGGVSDYIANLFGYQTAVASGGGGMASTDRVVHAYSIGRFSNSTTTNRGTQIGSTNPVTLGGGDTASLAAGTDPTGWTTTVSAPASDAQIAAINLSTTPLGRLTKNTASTNVMTCDLGGLMVEYMAVQVKSLTPVTGADAAQALDKDKQRSAANASEADAAQILGFTKPIVKTIIPATESSAARALTLLTLKSLTAATEADAARALVKTKRRTLGIAGETDEARDLQLRLTEVLEADTALVLRFSKRVWSYDEAQGWEYEEGVGWSYQPGMGWHYDEDQEWTYERESTFTYG